MAILVKKIDYALTKPDGKRENWNVYIAGRNTDECLSYLTKTVGGNIQITSVNEIGRLDAVTDELRQIIASPLLKSKIGKKKTNKINKKDDPKDDPKGDTKNKLNKKK